MRPKTFQIKGALSDLALSRLSVAMRKAAEEGFTPLRLDLRAHGEIPSDARASIQDLRTEMLDHYNVPVTLIPDFENPVDDHDDAWVAEEEIHLFRDHGIRILDVENCETLKNEVLAAENKGHSRLFINFTDVDFMSAAGIMTLVTLQKELRKRGGEVVLLIPDKSPVYDLIRDNSLAEEFRIGFTAGSGN